MALFRKGKIVQKTRKIGLCYGPYYVVKGSTRTTCKVILLKNPAIQLEIEKDVLSAVSVVPIGLAPDLAKRLYVKAVRDEPIRGMPLSMLKTKISTRFLSDDNKLALFYSKNGLYRVYGSILTAKEYVSLGKTYIRVELDKLYTL